MARNWEWWVGHVSGFGEVAFETKDDVLGTRAEYLDVRRLTVLQLGQPKTPNGPPHRVLAKWFPEGLDMLAHGPFSLRRDRLGIVAMPSKELQSNLVRAWTGLVTAQEPPRIV